MTDNSDKDGGRLRGVARKTVSNSFWSYLGFALGKLAAFGATVILANILVPEQFGLVAFCIIAMQFFDIVGRFGLDSALISRGATAEEDANTVFVMGIGAGLVAYGIAWISAPWIAAFFAAPEVELMLRVMATAVLFDSVALVHNALLSLRLRFRRRLIPIVTKSVAKAMVSVALAFQGFGAWSLIFGQVAGSVFATIAFWMVLNWRPRMHFSGYVARDIARYSGNMIGVELIGAVRATVDTTLVGRYFGATGLGYYALAYRLPELIIRSLNDAVGKVTHPVLVELRGNPEDVSEYYAAYIRFIALITLPIGVGLAVISEAFVLTFYGSNWERAILPMQAISLALAVSSVSFAPGVYYKAMNRPDILRNISLAKLPFLLAVTWYSVRWGIDGVAIANLALALAFVGFDCYTVSRFSGISLSVVAKALAPAVAASMGMGALVGLLTETMSTNGVIELLVAVTTGIPIYLLLVRAISPESFSILVSYVKLRRKDAV